MNYELISVYRIKRKNQGKILEKLFLGRMAKEEKEKRGDKIAIFFMVALIILTLVAPTIELMLFFLLSGIIIGFLHLIKK